MWLCVAMAMVTDGPGRNVVMASVVMASTMWLCVAMAMVTDGPCRNVVMASVVMASTVMAYVVMCGYGTGHRWSR